jgi:hypothetical protein
MSGPILIHSVIPRICGEFRAQKDGISSASSSEAYSGHSIRKKMSAVCWQRSPVCEGKIRELIQGNIREASKGENVLVIGE